MAFGDNRPYRRLVRVSVDGDIRPDMALRRCVDRLAAALSTRGKFGCPAITQPTCPCRSIARAEPRLIALVRRQFVMPYQAVCGLPDRYAALPQLLP